MNRKKNWKNFNLSVDTHDDLKGLNGLSQILIVYHLKQAFKRFYYLVKFGIKRKYLI